MEKVLYGKTLQLALDLRKEGKHIESYAMLKKACKEKDGYACFFMKDAYDWGGWTVCLNKTKALKYFQRAVEYGCIWICVVSKIPNNYQMGLILQQYVSSRKRACDFFTKACDSDGLTFAAFDVWVTGGDVDYLIKAADYGDCRAKYELIATLEHTERISHMLAPLAEQGNSNACIKYMRDYSNQPRYVAMSRDWKFILKRLKTTNYDELCYYGQICSAYRKKHKITPNPLKLDPYWKALLVYETKFRCMKAAMMFFFFGVPLYKDIRKLIWDHVSKSVSAWYCPELNSQTLYYNVLPVRLGWSRLFIKSKLCVVDFCRLLGERHRFVQARNHAIVIWEGKTKEMEIVTKCILDNFEEIEFIKEYLPITDYCLE
jgi:TPR repeat protein